MQPSLYERNRRYIREQMVALNVTCKRLPLYTEFPADVSFVYVDCMTWSYQPRFILHLLHSVLPS